MGILENKVILITGASSGIGEVTARLAAKEGARVVIAARREEKGLKVAEEINNEGGTAIFVKTDVKKTDDIKNMISRTIKEYGVLDCAVNNAGIGGPILTPVADIDEESWDDVMNVNLRAVWMCMKHEIPEMLKQRKSSIVNISSVYGLKASDVGHAAYTTSKHAIIGLTKTAAVDYATLGIRVNAVAPGYTHSEIIDPVLESAPDLINMVVNRHTASNRLANTDEAAKAILWLCSDDSSFVNGAVIQVDGGGTPKLY